MKAPKKNLSVYRLQLHDHACLIYENETEWEEAVIPFLIQGLQRGDKCIYALNHHRKQTIIDYLQNAGQDTVSLEASGQLLFLSAEDLPETNNQDRLEQIEDFAIEFIKYCLAEGYPAVRLTNEALYSITGIEPAWNLVEANSRSNALIFPHYPVISLCQYDRWKTDPTLLKYAIISHPVIIKNGIFYENFSIMPDELFLAKNTDRWEAEHWLRIIERENRERENFILLKHTVENSVQPMLAVSPDGSLLSCNDALCDLMHLSRDELHNLRQIMPEWDYYFQKISAAINHGGGYQRFAGEFMTKEGKKLVLDLAIFIKYDEAGNIEFYYGSITDITSQAAAEEALRKSEAKYRLIAENAYDMIALLDLQNFVYKYLSPSYERVVGYTAEELLGKSGFQYIHPEDLDPLLDKLYAGIKTGHASAQYRWRAKDGSYIWLETIGKIIDYDEYAGDGLLVTRDITEKKLAELALKKELDYRNYLIENMNEVFIIYDLTKSIAFVNGSVKNVLGYEPQEIIGRSIIEFLADCEKGPMTLQIQNRLEGEAGTFETMVLTKNGTEALVRIKSSPIMENGSITGVMLLLEDISEHRKLEREMARLSQLHTIGEMAAGIGHEIRNPMTTVKGFLQIMKLHDDFKDHQPYFNIMLEELERANEIISEFLALAKNKRVDLEAHNLNAIITALYPLLVADAILTDKHVYLELQEIPDLMLDEKEIRQLLLNLVRNGLEATRAKGRVTIRTFQEDAETIVLAVSDDGRGIDPELLQKLGTPFLTTKDNGTGLGLAICYSIAARHKASIEPVNNSPGTTFMVRFNMNELNPGQLRLALE